MLYSLFTYLDKKYDLIGAGLFQYISFRAGAAIVLSLLITILFGTKVIRFLKKKEIYERIRDLGLDKQLQKTGTPTMGGTIIIAGIILPTLLMAQLDNIYIILLIITTCWLGLIGLLDDYIKVYKKNKKGLAGHFKIIGQVGLGIIVGLTLHINDSVVIREWEKETHLSSAVYTTDALEQRPYQDVKSMKTTIPFLKNNELDYSTIFPGLSSEYTWIIYTLVAILVITGVSNGSNITDGADGLAAGTSGIIGLTLAIFIYLSGRVDFSDYLNIMYIPNLGELVIFCMAFVGACLGFLWYNAYPAQIFMGDTGSLTLGGIIAVLSLAARKELMIPLVCGIFFIESLSVIIQVFYFRYTRIRYGTGKRVFLMAPLHHHYQKLQISESKLVSRFWIIGILLAILTLSTLKLR